VNETAREPSKSSASLPTRVAALVRAIQDNDVARIEDAVVRLSRARRTLAPRVNAHRAACARLAGPEADRSR